jgi:hypothetical protein
MLCQMELLCNAATGDASLRPKRIIWHRFTKRPMSCHGEGRGR